MKTSVRLQAVGVAMVLSNVLDHSERDFVLCRMLRRHFESRNVANAGGDELFPQTRSSQRGVDTSNSIVVGSMFR